MWLCTPVNTVLERPRQEDLGLATSQPRQVIEHGSPARDPASLPSLPPSPSQELQPGEDAYSYGSYVAYEKPRGRKPCAPNSGIFWNLLPRPSSPPSSFFPLFFAGICVCLCVCKGACPLEEVWRPEVGQSGQAVSPYLWRQALLLNLKLIDWPVRKLQDPPVLAPSPGVADALPSA